MDQTERVDRIVALLLRLHPARFRERYGEAVRETHGLRSAEARRAGRWAHATFRLREYGGLAVSALREHWSSRESGQAPGGRDGNAHDTGKRATVSMGGNVRELGPALRRLLRTPGFTLASVLMLGLGIGASSAVYTLVYSVVLRPLPYRAPDRLVWLDHGAPGFGWDRGIGITVWQYVQYGGSSRLLDGIALAQRSAVTLVEGTAAAERIGHATVTPSLAAVLGVSPLVGRWFEDTAGHDVVLSHSLWQRRWNSDPAVLGRLLRLSGTDYRVIGVMPPGFAMPDRSIELWTAREYTAAWPDGGFNYHAVGRMRPGVTLVALQAELQSLTDRAPAVFGDQAQVARRVREGRITAVPVRLSDHVIGSFGDTLWMLLGAVLLVLLTAWANVANLFLARADARRREVAVRRAIGASRGAIARLFLAEGALLGASSWVLGMALAYTAVRTITGFAPLNLPRAGEIALNAHVALVALALALVATMALTAIPLSQRTEAAQTLRDGGRGTTAGRARLRFRAGLMAGQVALALMLLAGSGLLVRSWLNVRGTSPGFHADNALFFEVGLSSGDYPDRERQALFHTEVAARIAALPGVDAVAFATCLPLDGYCWGEGVVPEGGAAGERVVVSMRRVSAGFFAALELPLVAGRSFTTDAGPGADEVVLSERAAKRLFPDGSAVGRQVGYGSGGPDAQWMRVVGVAADAATTSVMESSPELVVYLPIRDARLETVSLNRMSFIVRAGREPSAVAISVRTVIREIDAQTAVARVRTLADVLAADRAQIALATVLLVLAAAIALLLGAIGIYAVFTYVVGRRTAEFGLRLALGARATHVFRTIFRQAGVITLTGFAFGMAGAAALTRSLATLLFGVQPLDAGVFLLASVILLTIAFAAAFVPARRAWRLQPVQAMRQE